MTDCPYSFRHGAPMGRNDEGTFNLIERVHLERLPVNAQGYDAAGAYWGLGAPLYCYWQGSSAVGYLRAKTRAEAKGKVLALPALAGAKFYR